ncbi:MAG: DUF4230 domain-containing protein, partial [Bacteroidetes bacterium]
HAIVVEKVEALGKMELMKYHFKDVITHEKMQGWLPSSKVVLMVHGEVVACIDFTRLDSADVSERGDTVFVALPAPEICYSKVDHSQSKVIDTYWTIFEGASLADEAYKLAEQEILNSALKSGILEQAKQQARQFTGPMLGIVAGKPVKVWFKESPVLLP